MPHRCRLAWSTTLFDGAREFDIIQCHFGALGLKAVLLRAAGALKGKIVTAFHGEDITNYPQQFSGNIYAPLFASGDLFLPISARWNDTLAALGCPSGKIRVHRMGVDCRRFAIADAARRIQTVRFASSRSRVWSKRKGLPMRFERSRNCRFRASTSLSETDRFATVSSSWQSIEA